MNLSITNNFLISQDKDPFLRPASIISTLLHVLIIILAMYGLPKFGRKLPDDLKIIAFELMPIVDQTNVETKQEAFKIEEDTKNEQPKKIEKRVKPIEKKKPDNLKPTPNEPINKPIPVEPIEKPLVKKIKIPNKKPEIFNEKNKPIKKPNIPQSQRSKSDIINDNKIKKDNSKINNIVSKPLSKPQIIKNKSKDKQKIEQKTNPLALTSVLKTLEKVKETNLKKEEEQKKLKELIQKKKQEKEKRKDAAENLKDIVSNSASLKPKNFLQPLGIDKLDLLKLHLRNCWNPPVGAAGAENLIVDIFIELNKQGNILKVKWINQGMKRNNSFYIAAANAAIRAVKDCEPLPLPPESFNQWKNLTLVFDPKELFGGY